MEDQEQQKDYGIGVKGITQNYFLFKQSVHHTNEYLMPRNVC
jgi:hypothetical protein